MQLLSSVTRRPSVLRLTCWQYLGIPLAAGLTTRLVVLYTVKSSGLKKVLSFIGPIAPLGLLYTIIVLFASQVCRSLYLAELLFYVLVG